MLDAAKDWGIPPWKLDGSPKVLWYARYKVLRETMITAEKAERLKRGK